MPLRKFELITRYFRTFDYTKLDVRDESDLPKTFQAAEEWSNHIQSVSIELYSPGTNLTVDEFVKNKPTPVGFKVWVIAQQGFFLQWLWHVKASPYKAVIVELPTPTPHITSSRITSSRRRSSSAFFGSLATVPQARHALTAASPPR
uniref:PiggyBac transposable element-derived protein domain-containing protein n=1 Tax=Fusarium oxysporum (strain Fo5176) TaxID=660025 RepID=A0A0D2XRU5_FUSOF